MSVLRSSVDNSKIKLRIKSLGFLIVPLVNLFGDQFGVSLLSEDVELILDSFAVVLFVLFQAWGWLRAALVKYRG